MSSLYVHIPFCEHICSYCDFCKVFYKEDWADQYLEVLKYEIIQKNIQGLYDTIYIGGGTPSSLSLHQLQKLLQMIQPFSKNVKEYTIEVNPESMNQQKLDLLKEYGINRLSIGVQTFHDHILKNIERYHSSQQAIDLIRQAKKRGIDDINVDLIYGLPHQSLEDIYQDIDILVKEDISHVSIYSFILEDHTILKNQNYRVLDDEEDAHWYQCINEYMKKNGFIHYEVSNYYRHKPSLHNLVYWHYEDYEGIGLSSHSLKNHCRIENTRSLTQYLEKYHVYEIHQLKKNDEIFEYLMMGLRLYEGIDLQKMQSRYHIDALDKYSQPIQKYRHLKMLEVDNGFLKVTEKGMYFLNTILVDFLNQEMKI